MNMSKCEFFNMCKYANKKSYTCNDKHEANGYCGVYEKFNKHLTFLDKPITISK